MSAAALSSVRIPGDVPLSWTAQGLSMARDSTDFLLDIALNARRVVGFVAGRSWEAFATDVACQYAVDRALLIIGEAMNQIDEAHRTALEAQGIPVRKIIGLRNRMAHQYWVIDPAIIWGIATQQMNPLLAAVESLEGEPPQLPLQT